MADYQKQQKALTKNRTLQIKQIANYLGLKEVPPQENCNHYFSIVLTDELNLGFYYHYANGKIAVSVDINRETKRKYEGYSLYLADATSVSVSANRDSQAIAKDIQRRVINSDAYQESREYLNRRIADSEKEILFQAKRKKFLISQGFNSFSNNGNEVTRYNYCNAYEGGISSSISVAGSRFEVSIANESQYKRLVKLLNKFHVEVEEKADTQ